MRKLKLNTQQAPESFSDLLWLTKGTPTEIIFAAKQHKLTCVCYLATTPAESAIWFHIKTKIYA